MRLTYHTALVLRALLDGRHYGFDIMDATHLPSGTVYPILRRLNAEGSVRSRWEKDGLARRDQRPPRRYYELTAGGTAVAHDSAARVREMAHAASRLSPAKA
ncbi:MAG: PadR family transcriptional regulator [Vicinamibacterales bacterium]